MPLSMHFVENGLLISSVRFASLKGVLSEYALY